MDKRAIGVFDSGMGGLTAVKRLIEVLPGEDIIYLGDTGRVPYGGRSRETIIEYSRQDIAFLRSFDIKCIVAACGTVSTVALEAIENDYPIPIYGVAGMAAKAAAKATRNGRIGLIGTKASIGSGAYNRLILAELPEAEVIGRACPLFVPLVENGRVGVDDEVLRLVAEDYLEPIKRAGVDTLIMGCTHYPIIRAMIGRVMGDNVTLIDPGGETAVYVSERLKNAGMLSGCTKGERRYYVTDSPDGFGEMARLFLGSGDAYDISQVTINNF
ncbi:MAG: glutamate racemase [Oscillospiraceae bacterium]|nr:glutamate racemase [Oscillospiraceae bacterium]